MTASFISCRPDTGTVSPAEVPVWRRFRRGACAVAGVVLALALGGCGHGPGLMDSARTGPFYGPQNYSGEQILPTTLRRVLVMPVHVGTVAEPESAEMLDEVVRTALMRQSRFEVVTLSRSDCLHRFSTPAFSSSQALPHGLLQTLQKSYACDAVLFIDVTAYRAYRPQMLGFRAKLALVEDLHLVWNFDEIFSADDAAVVNSVRRYYYRDDSRVTAPVDTSITSLQSPSQFATYAATVMFKTLPLR